MITSYGGLPEGLTKEDFFNCCSAPRNKAIMRIFKDVDLVEQLGSGMKRILKVYDTSIFDIRDNFLIVTFPFDKEKILNDSVNDSVNDRLTMSEKKILEQLRKDNHLSAVLLNEKTGISVSQINRIYKSLKEKGYIERIGTDKVGYWKILK